MNKKQKNRKIVAQNRRNRIINRRYSSTVKTLSKLFLQKIENLQNGKEENNEQAKSQILNVMNNLYSIIDKAVKKGVLHKNAAARKKSKISLLSNKVQ